MLLTIHARARAKSDSIEWMDETTCKVRVTAPAEKGKANKAILKLLSKELNVSQQTLELVRGFTTSMKHVRIKNTDH